jgi:hypothetical protein
MLRDLEASALFQIRRTRSAPPGRASENGRRETYGAALAQFDELMTAAQAVGPAARPLPLFYALSQAGRAIAAAHAEDPGVLRGHGITAGNLPSGQVLDVTVEVNGTSGRTVDSFGSVARATGSEVPTQTVSLRELWSSLPEAFGFLHDPAEAVPLLLVPKTPPPEAKVFDWSRAQATVMVTEDPEKLGTHLEKYFPSASGVRVVPSDTEPGVAMELTKHGFGVSVTWVSERSYWHHAEIMGRVAPAGGGRGARWMRPGVGGVELSPLMTWWMLLFGLSMLARYEPAVWIEELKYDTSKVSAGLAQLLEVGTEQLPHLVLDALNNNSTGYPEL